MSPTARSLHHLRELGWTAAVVERWNPYARIRQDLFGFADIVAVKPGFGILAVQSTSGSNVAARVAKITAEPKSATWREAGGLIVVHGWRKVGAKGDRKKWALREEWVG